MKQLTLRGFDHDVERTLQKVAEQHGISLNKAALLLLREGAGLSKGAADKVGNSLDHLAGSWPEDEAEAFLESLEVFETIDESLVMETGAELVVPDQHFEKVDGLVIANVQRS